jgi:large subunit ribosomal protein L17
MRHRKSGRKLGRSASHRKAMFRNMVTSMIHEEQIVTTVAKAKEMRPMIERLITLAKNNIDGQVNPADRVAAIRQAGKFVRGREALHKLFNELGERFDGRPGGYTRIIRNGTRLGDNAQMAIIQLIDYNLYNSLDEGEGFEADVAEESAAEAEAEA